MDGNRLILHVGAPKCASSSLQVALSEQPDFSSRSGERFRYAIITSEGDVMFGDALRHRAASALCRYAVSADANVLAGLGEARRGTITTTLNAMLRECHVVLSCESWISCSETFRQMHLLDRIDADCEVVGYVRPQPEFLNACWWQWAAWTDVDFETWLYFSSFGTTCSWAGFMDGWASVAGVTSVHPRLLCADVVPGFFHSLGCDHQGAGRSNRSLPGVALRFLQRHRELRPGMNDSDIDFVLERALGEWIERVPWVLSPGFVQSYIEQCRPDNERLLDKLSAAERSAMLADRRWWDSSSYADRLTTPPGAGLPDAAEMDGFALALAKALRDRDQELQALRAQALIGQAPP